MKLQLAYYGDPFLRKKCAKIEVFNPELRQLVKDMEETMFAHDGVGLAAPQIHKDLALFIVSMPVPCQANNWQQGKTRIFINPKIVEKSEDEWPRGEGCLSIPNVYATVIRPMHIKVEAYELDGNLFVEQFSGNEARAIMHENDHINGVLFIDRVRGKERQELEDQLRTVKKKYYK